MTNGGCVSDGRPGMHTRLRSLTTTRIDKRMKKLPNIHPGEILLEEFLKPANISSYRLAKDTHMPATRVSDIVRKKRGITADTAIRLSRYFGNSPDFWLGLQAEYDLRQEQGKPQKSFNSIVPLRSALIS
jgi:addiction module HigA family antidote